MKIFLLRMVAMAITPFVWFLMVHFPPPPHYFICVGGRWIHCSEATDDDHLRATGFTVGRVNL